ncbi:hypothetical protein DFR42_101647 [Undibacterium pigrum]|uniref:Uncharacterized protein n=1 Tax=Undibacterium pigrum TaxID=401470 RepID=A0A318JDM8_9BURK|nr:hypothetical protein DFR42_101647 [Undibacterium pigrum]
MKKISTIATINLKLRDNFLLISAFFTNFSLNFRGTLCQGGQVAGSVFGYLVRSV